MNLRLPVGYENFAEIRKEQLYYVDKTKLIEQLFEWPGKVKLFTRPRRFGKTLNMSMLRYFFEIGTDKSLFDGLYIAQNKKLCDEYMGKFPVIFISLKGVEGLDFEMALASFSYVIGWEADRFRFLLDSEKLSDEDKEQYRALISKPVGNDKINSKQLIESLKTLAVLLYKHYGQKTVILIDEYDVPLAKAFLNGYYRDMIALIRGLFGNALKTNDYLQFAVLTGCLRVSKESIFTGMNNFNVLSITDLRFDEQFGFTEKEVKEILAYYDLEDHLPEMKEWYDGYRFGDADVYCPWDVINHVDRLRADPEAEPESYWINTSGNDLVKRFINKADTTTREEIEQLVAGGTIAKSLRLDLTYDELDSSIQNLWSVLFTTGYLTQADRAKGGVYQLKIPNAEVKEIYEYQIKEWFSNTVLPNTDWLQEFWEAFATGKAEVIEKQLTKIFSKTISFYDVKRSFMENSYHTFLLGMLVGNRDWGVSSNREGGEGRGDIFVNLDDPDAGLVIELKRAESFAELEAKSKEALAQIHARRYDKYLRSEGRNDIWAYGIAFYKKRCKVVAEKLAEK